MPAKKRKYSVSKRQKNRKVARIKAQRSQKARLQREREASLATPRPRTFLSRDLGDIGASLPTSDDPDGAADTTTPYHNLLEAFGVTPGDAVSEDGSSSDDDDSSRSDSAEPADGGDPDDDDGGSSSDGALPESGASSFCEAERPSDGDESEGDDGNSVDRTACLNGPAEPLKGQRAVDVATVELPGVSDALGHYPWCWQGLKVPAAVLSKPASESRPSALFPVDDEGEGEACAPSDGGAGGAALRPAALLKAVATYRDVLWTALPTDVPPTHELRAVALHAIHHVALTQLYSRWASGRRVHVGDRGFTRPRVLFVVSTRAVAYEVGEACCAAALSLLYKGNTARASRRRSTSQSTSSGTQSRPARPRNLSQLKEQIRQPVGVDSLVNPAGSKRTAAVHPLVEWGEREAAPRADGLTPALRLSAMARGSLGDNIEDLLRQCTDDSADSLILNWSEFRKDLGPQSEHRTRPGLAAEHALALRNNSDDNCCLGLSMLLDRFLLGTYLKRAQEDSSVSFPHALSPLHLFCKLYSADVIIGTPLGLCTAAAKDSSWDFLSSVEIAVVFNGDLSGMYDTAKLRSVISALSSPPSRLHPYTNISRLSPVYTAECAPVSRQTIFLSSRATPFLQTLMRKKCLNWGAFGPPLVYCPPPAGVIGGLLATVSHVFRPCRSASSLPTSRGIPTQHPHTDCAAQYFSTFKSFVWPSIAQEVAAIRTITPRNPNYLIVVPEYFDYVTVREWLAEQNNDAFGELSEYTSAKDVNIALKEFNAHRRPCLLTTERFLFHVGAFPKKSKHVVSIGPLNAEFIYARLAQSLDTSPSGASNPTMLTIYCQIHDSMPVGRIVGQSNWSRLHSTSTVTRITE